MNILDAVIQNAMVGGGGGGGGGGDEPELYIVTITRSSKYEWSADHTYSEINAAFTDGKSIVFKFGTYVQFAGNGIDAGSHFFRAIMLADGIAYSISIVEQYGVMGNEYSTTTPAGVVTATDGMTTAQKATTRSNLGIVEETIVSVSDTNAVIAPTNGTTYNCGTLDSLTITDPPAQGDYGIVFTSGATPTVTTIPETIIGLEDFAAEANTLYEINVLDNRAVFKGWPLGVGA